MIRRIFKNKFIYVVLLTVIFIFTTGCNRPNYKTISASEAIKELEKDDSIVLLDVRDYEEHQEERIPNSVLIPLNELKYEVTDKIKDKETRIFIYCHSGRRSREAARTLSRLGYKNVYNIGGIINWEYELER